MYFYYEGSLVRPYQLNRSFTVHFPYQLILTLEVLWIFVFDTFPAKFGPDPYCHSKLVLIKVQNRSLTLKLNKTVYTILGLTTTHYSFVIYIRLPHTILNHYVNLKLSHPLIIEIALLLYFYSNAELTIK